MRIEDDIFKRPGTDRGSINDSVIAKVSVQIVANTRSNFWEWKKEAWTYHFTKMIGNILEVGTVCHVASRATILHSFRNRMHVVVSMSGSHCIPAIHIANWSNHMKLLIFNHVTSKNTKRNVPPETKPHGDLEWKGGKNRRFPSDSHILEEPWNQRSHCGKEVEPTDTKR